VYLYSVDDLQDIINENMRARHEEARKADSLIDTGLAEYRRQLRTLDAVDTLRVYREQAEQQRDAELERALRALERGERAEAVMAELARALTNKLIHVPSIGLRKAGERGELDRIAWLRQWLALDDDNESGE
jgi:glutamyl-tRNA reductase